jgi:hypothetical protein
MVHGPARNWIAVNAVQQSNLNNYHTGTNMKPNIQSHFKFILIVAVTALALAGSQAQAQLNYQTPYVFTTLASTAGNLGAPCPPCIPQDGCGPAASFFGPRGMAVDGAGNLYVADQYYGLIRKITPDGCVTTIVGSSAGFYYPVGVALDTAGNLYVTDTGYGDIRKVTPTGVVTGFAGGFAPGPTAESLSYIAIDSAGNLYAPSRHSIVKISPTGIVAILAGSGVQGYADGVGSAAQFWNPTGIAVDGSGNVYVCESGTYMGGGQVIRKITPTGVVSTFAGQFGVAGYTDGTGTAALFYNNGPLAVDSLGNIYVGDAGTIRKITPAGVITTLAGSATLGSADGIGAAVGFSSPGGLAVGSNGAIYVADANNDVRVGVPTFVAQVQQPINADGTSVFNVRRGVVPVKFTLTQGGVATCTLPPATIALTRTAGGTTGSIDECVYSGSADTGSNFRIDSCQYIYNLSSSALGVGTYRVDIMINGQVVGSVSFQLK